MIYTIPVGSRRTGSDSPAQQVAHGRRDPGCGADADRVRREEQESRSFGRSQPDRFLFDRGNEAIMKERWTDAREYYRQVVDNYPGSPLRADAKLGVATPISRKAARRT